MNVPALIPPFRFSTVQHQLYRGSYPTLKNFRFLKRLSLKTIVSVIPEPPTSDLVGFCATEKIANHHFYAEKFTSDNVTVSPSTVVQILQLMINQENLPLYIHCLDGANVTGIIIMVLRKLQNWTKVATVAEFCRFTRDHGIEKDESEYLATFSEEIVVTGDVPKWLWNGIRITKHPTMIIHQPDLESSTPHPNEGSGAMASVPITKWETEAEKAEAIIRQFEEASRTRTMNEAAGDGADEVDIIEEALQDIPIPRSLEALDLAGLREHELSGDIDITPMNTASADQPAPAPAPPSTTTAEEDELSKVSEVDASPNRCKESTTAPVDSVQLGKELFVFTAQKAGMQQVDKEHVNKVVYDMSKDSRFFQNSIKKNDKVDERLRSMQQQAATMSRSRADVLLHQTDQMIAKIEAQRDLRRTKVVVDMDMFYAAVEMRDNPKLRDVPLAVGGMSMISTTNYIARKFGVRAAMPGFIGKELCPDLVFVRPNFTKYQEVAAQFRQVFAEYDPDFSAFSLDEAVLDITEYMAAHWAKYASNAAADHYDVDDGEHSDEPEDQEGKAGDDVLQRQRLHVAGAIVAEMRKKTFTLTQLTCSAGVAVNVFLAKICSDMNKPNGQYLLPFDRSSIVAFVRQLSARKVGGIGKVMEKLLGGLGMSTMEEVYEKRVVLFHVFSEKTASWLLRTSLGIQEYREASERKSFSRESTFGKSSNAAQLERICHELCERVAHDLERAGQAGKTITLKLKCVDFTVRTRAMTSQCAVHTVDGIFAIAKSLLVKEFPLSLRLMGVRVSALTAASDATQPTTKHRQLGINQFASALAHEEGSADSAEDTDDQAPKRIARQRTPSVKRQSPMLEFIQRDSASANNMDTPPRTNVDFCPCPICGKAINSRDILAVNEHIDACVQADGGASGEPLATITEEHKAPEEPKVPEDINVDSFCPCPICGKMINASNIIAVNQHVDECVQTPARKRLKRQLQQGQRSIQSYFEQ
ncbi:TPA: hypothetical protein N0F65_001214 [Lagenidium giganteum]|uniref:DNA polymerase kappa n=1 Tax=Lagenidium giganteum TaxID=4803 RepID=A0AAV2Z198_9STRA|nr:TPA: hypothetical protein N0F65_001214 [Lagenidium giganteum]